MKETDNVVVPFRKKIEPLPSIEELREKHKRFTDNPGLRRFRVFMWGEEIVEQGEREGLLD